MSMKVKEAVTDSLNKGAKASVRPGRTPMKQIQLTVNVKYIFISISFMILTEKQYVSDEKTYMQKACTFILNMICRIA